MSRIWNNGWIVQIIHSFETPQKLLHIATVAWTGVHISESNVLGKVNPGRVCMKSSYPEAVDLPTSRKPNRPAEPTMNHTPLQLVLLDTNSCIAIMCRSNCWLFVGRGRKPRSKSLEGWQDPQEDEKRKWGATVQYGIIVCGKLHVED